MILPKNSIVDVRLLEQVVGDYRTTSYKLFWFLGILKEIMNGNTTFTFRRIVCHMIAASWYPLVEYHLQFGAVDKLYNLVMEIHSKYGIESDISESDLLDFLNELEDSDIEVLISKIYKYVPYRLISPFFSNQLKGLPDGIKNKIISELSRKDGTALYIIDDLSKSITINKEWFDYLYANQSIVYGWLNYKLVLFLQNRNPSVPAIPCKLNAPIKRDLTVPRKVWRLMSSESDLYDIYSGLKLNPANYEKLGNLSIDHFIPWSFVMHDEFWNLIPTFSRVNSSKNNRLPSIDSYIDSFCDIQYQTYIFMLKKDYFKKYLDDYFHINNNLNLLSKEIDKKTFSNSIKSNVMPLFQIASNQGYGIWENNVILK